MSATVSSVLGVVRNDTSMRGCARMKASKMGREEVDDGLGRRRRAHAAGRRVLATGDALPQRFRLVEDAHGVLEGGLPRGESFTPRLARMKSGSPSSVSSDLIWWLTADWVRPSRSAARVKFSVSATTRNVRSCESSIPSPPLPGRLAGDGFKPSRNS